VVTLQDGSEKQSKYLNDTERQESVAAIEKLESQCQNPEYLKPTLKTGARTAIETGIGYAAGRLCSHLI